MKILHFDSVGGASGDMILGALIDLGVSPDAIQSAISSLGVEEIHLHADKLVVGGLHGTRAEVHTHEGEDHHGHNHSHAHGTHHGEHHHAPHRNLADIEALIRAGRLSATVQELAIRVFQRLGDAEARVHGTTVDRIHFHEVGALDSIADIVGSCVALEQLGVDAVTFGPLPQGRGVIKCEHGTYPNPPPATVLLLHGLPIEQTDEPFELVTPTGAALLSTWRSQDRVPTGSRPAKTGYGFGHRALAQRVNCLRAVLFDYDEPKEEADAVHVLETNLDDCTPEVVGALCERLLSEGALDVFTVPAFMKKQRPGILLTVLCEAAVREKLLDIILRESTTFGVREHTARRTILAREIEKVATPYGEIRVKVGRRGAAVYTRSPEMDDCIRAARGHGVPVREVYAAAAQSHDKVG